MRLFIRWIVPNSLDSSNVTETGWPFSDATGEAGGGRDPFFVFLTDLYFGDLGGALPSPDSALIGVAKADKICERAANTSTYASNKLRNRRWKAWLSDSDPNSAPSTRFTSKDSPYDAVGYANVDGTLVAANWAALTSVLVSLQNGGFKFKYDGSLFNSKTDGTVYGAWTNTTYSGDRFGNSSRSDCNDWTDGTSASRGYRAQIGNPVPIDARWTDGAAVNCDSSMKAIYCFEQP